MDSRGDLPAACQGGRRDSRLDDRRRCGGTVRFNNLARLLASRDGCEPLTDVRSGRRSAADAGAKRLRPRGDSQSQDSLGTQAGAKPQISGRSEWIQNLLANLEIYKYVAIHGVRRQDNPAEQEAGREEEAKPEEGA